MPVPKPPKSARNLTADRRDATADKRDVSADKRDVTADKRDTSADRRDVTADKRETRTAQRDVAVYGWLLVITLGLLVFLLSGHSQQHGEIQAQRRAVALSLCEEGNQRHAAIFQEVHKQVLADRLLPPVERTIQLRQDSHRERYAAVTLPWQDCPAVVHRQVH